MSDKEKTAFEETIANDGEVASLVEEADAIALAEVLRQAQASGNPLGSLTVLKRYERWRRTENWFTLSLTDFLNRAFSNRFWPLVIARRTGIWVISSVKPLRRLILQLMTGFFGKLPESIRGK